MLQVPTEQELHAQYRKMRMKIIWEAHSENSPDIWTFTGDFDRDHYSGKTKLDTVILKLDVFLDEIHFDGERTIRIPSTDHLTDGVFAAMAKIGRTLIFSIDLLRDDNFVKVLLENKFRFSRIYIWHSDDEMVKQLGVARLHKTKLWSFRPKYKATAADLKQEFSKRLKDSYSMIFGVGGGLLLCIATCPIGALVISAGLILLPVDALVTGINYTIVRRRESRQATIIKN